MWWVWACKLMITQLTQICLHSWPWVSIASGPREHPFSIVEDSGHPLLVRSRQSLPFWFQLFEAAIRSSWCGDKNPTYLLADCSWHSSAGQRLCEIARTIDINHQLLCSAYERLEVCCWATWRVTASTWLDGRSPHRVLSLLTNKSCLLHEFSKLDWGVR